MTFLTSFNQLFISVTADSRQVVPGALFLAYPGVHSDGRRYIAQAVAAGASAVLWESQGFAWDAAIKVANLGVSQLKNQVAEIAAEFYQYPSRKLDVIGVTGTNGKTSVSQWIAQAMQALGEKTAVIGTIGSGFADVSGNGLVETNNTTPDAILLQKMLADYASQGAVAVAMEVSSHGLDQGRVNAIEFDFAVFTNLTRDHLDYHETMDAYASAKRKLFDWPSLRTAVVNVDDDFGKEMAESLRVSSKSIVTYGLVQGDVRADKLTLSANGISMKVITPQGVAVLSAPVLGRFNAYNLLAVLATLLARQVPLGDAISAIAQIKPVDGRMQQFGGKDKPLVVVDYAHTPDALENVLVSLREQTQGKLICVFGCGGDRDAGKRPLMGSIAEKYAHHVVVTSDNPRNENPALIIEQIVNGMTVLPSIAPDRAVAIQQAIKFANKDDVVLLAGKGHEEYQEIGGLRTPFSDIAVAQSALLNWVPDQAMAVGQ
ncbi:UDP-N-acetylmuramoyl-L-alanyl-D-glutamate--2,6-diaminopimelate ligase [Methylotenera sp.]|uniref:UDP-N-acetylmuramoyl-L-alanyl-D-glutamate--2, 6-diaminopimelate ligase n=1 Tax=Methylotenera sp. TaxID=2051956 RepID=UPI002735CC33|nr:UDP-N-acetylmuramoyl-L-alanyl-D-glutamate--2,6-diaminopimelate ligase [Methylotenera sp.]MDP3777465.1 UDP-N-acetylmuramoyl-L-alanyl-D-glutamate--2,6-diaminopimelate ligase [Methylotenera sp.]